MVTHIKHTNKEVFYFVTFTCFRWLPLIAESNVYDYLNKWSIQLSEKGIKICGYVIMPYHIHLIVYVLDDCQGLNYEIGEAKRFMAYEIVRRLKKLNKIKLLNTLSEAVALSEKRLGKKHQVFKKSFDAKQIEGNVQINAILDYIHENPVNGKWSLVDDYRDYTYSSVRFYQEGEKVGLQVWDFRTVSS